MVRAQSDKIPDVAVKYLIFYGPNEDRTGVKGIRSDAPEEAIEAYIKWYRENNRYENGRLRPKNIVRKALVISC